MKRYKGKGAFDRELRSPIFSWSHCVSLAHKSVMCLVILMSVEWYFEMTMVHHYNIEHLSKIIPIAERKDINDGMSTVTCEYLNKSTICTIHCVEKKQCFQPMLKENRAKQKVTVYYLLLYPNYSKSVYIHFSGV